MTLTALALILPACFALHVALGPNNVRAFTTASRRGFLAGFVGGIGHMLPFAAMIALVGLGLAALPALSEPAFAAVKLAGAAYLIYICWHLLRRPAPSAQTVQTTPKPARFRRNVPNAIGNAKAITIMTACFTLVTDPSAPLAPQYALLGSLFLGLEALAVATYAALGTGLKGSLTPLRLHRMNRGAGGFLIFSGLTMALSERP